MYLNIASFSKWNGPAALNCLNPLLPFFFFFQLQNVSVCIKGSNCYDKLWKTFQDTFLVDESVAIIHLPGCGVALPAALILSEFWEIPANPKSQDIENTTQREMSLTSINVLSSKRIFLLPHSFHLLYIFFDKTPLWGFVLSQICSS